MSLILEDTRVVEDNTDFPPNLPQSNSTINLLRANQELKKGNASLATTFLELEEQLDALRLENRQLNGMNDKLSRELARARQRQRNSISSDVQLDLMRGQLEQELSASQQRERSLKKRLQATENNVAHLEVEREESRAEIAKLLSHIETLKVENRVNLELIGVIDQLNFSNENFKTRVSKLEDENIELREALDHVHEEQKKRDATLRVRLQNRNSQVMCYQDTSCSAISLTTLPPAYNDDRLTIVSTSLRGRAEFPVVSTTSIAKDNLADVMLVDMNNQVNQLKVRYDQSELEKRWLQERINCLEKTIVRNGQANKSIMVDGDANNNDNEDSNYSYGLDQHQSVSYTATLSNSVSSVGIQTCIASQCPRRASKCSIKKRSLLAHLCCCIRCVD